MGYEEIRKKYAEMLNEELGGSKLQTKNYEEFRKQYLARPFTLYEKLCRSSEKILPISPDKKKIKPLEDAIRTAHLQVTPKGVTSFSLLFPILMIVGSILAFVIAPAFTAIFADTLPFLVINDGTPLVFFLMFFVFTAMILIVPLGNLPLTLAASWRMRASNQMVLAIFYMVTYMRHTSNFELAIDFAANHLSPPLNLDMKKVLWDVETEKYDTIKESFDSYLETWKGYNDEFIESVRLVEGSLLESSEDRRVSMLDKSLSVMLDETYEKMLHYAHDLKSPLTTLNMLGVVLPILGLVILPLVVTMLEGVYWYHLFMLYNVALPILVYYLGRSMLGKRPTGYGTVDITELNPELKKVRGHVVGKGKDSFMLTPLLLAVFVFSTLFLVGITPLIFGMFNQGYDVVWRNDDPAIATIDITDQLEIEKVKFYFYGWWERKHTGTDGKLVPMEDENGDPVRYGPFGLGAALLSLFIPLAFGLGLATYYRARSKNVMKIREETKRLEKEFASGLFQLGNRLADGLPVEIAFSKVAAVMQDSETGRFFELTSTNIANGMGVEQAIFDRKLGALREYPSNIIESSMKVLIESSRKGPLIASQAVINVSEYIKEMHRVDERLKDLMADVISSMKGQISFLTPAISGIVIGITSMITKILGTLTGLITGSSIDGGAAPGGDVLSLFGAGGVPTFYFQVIVGLYVVQLAYILTVLVNGIENGVDPMMQEEMLGKNLWSSTLLYAALALIVILVFNLIAGELLARSAGI